MATSDPWMTDQGDDALFYLLEQQKKQAEGNRGTTDPVNTTPGLTTGASSASTPYSAYAPKIVSRNGQTYLQEHGNERLLQPGQETEEGTAYAKEFAEKFPTGFQPGVGPQDNTGYQKTGWGFTSPSGGRGEFQYTPQSYAGDFMNLEGFRDQAALDADPNAQSSIKYIFRNATQGLAPGSESLDMVVQRLNDQGIPAKRVGPDKIDFGNGEGPVDVIRGGTDEVGYHAWQWLVDGTNQGGGGGGTQGAPLAVGPGIAGALGNSSLQEWLMGELQKVVQGGGTDLDQQALLQLMGVR